MWEFAFSFQVSDRSLDSSRFLNLTFLYLFIGWIVALDKITENKEYKVEE